MNIFNLAGCLNLQLRGRRTSQVREVTISDDQIAPKAPPLALGFLLEKNVEKLEHV